MYHRYLASTIILCLILTGCGQRGLEFGRQLYINSSHSAGKMAKYKQQEAAKRRAARERLRVEVEIAKYRLERELRFRLIGAPISQPIKRWGEPVGIADGNWGGKIYTWREGSQKVWVKIILSVNAEGIIDNVMITGEAKQ